MSTRQSCRAGADRRTAQSMSCGRWTRAVTGARCIRPAARHWYSRNADAGVTATIPTEPAANWSTGGGPGSQRVRTDAGPAMVIGMPLDDDDRLLRGRLDARAGPDAAGPRLVLTPGRRRHDRRRARAGRRTRRGGWCARCPSVAAAARDIAGGDLDRPARHRRRTGAAAADDVVQPHGRPAGTADRAGSPVRRRRQPRAALAAADPGRRGERARTAAGRTSTSAPPPPHGSIADEVDRFQRLVTDLLELARSDQAAGASPRSTWPSWPGQRAPAAGD